MTADTRSLRRAPAEATPAPTPRWVFVVPAVVTCTLAGSVGAALGWIGARLYQTGTVLRPITEGGPAGILWGTAGSLLTALAWTAAMTAFARRAIRRADEGPGVGRIALVGAALGVLAGAAATAVLHTAMSQLIFPKRSEPAIWFLGMLLGVPIAGFGGLICSLPYGLIVRRHRPKPRPNHVDTTV